MSARGEMSFRALMKMGRVIEEVEEERLRQHDKWGEQNWPDGTGAPFGPLTATAARMACERAFRDDRGNWRLILQEEVHEAWAESDPDRLRAELIQVAAVAVAWVEAIDRRGGAS